MNLPTQRQAAVRSEPRRLVIFSHPKVGKTSLTSQLPNCLILDLESGAGHYENMHIDVKQIALVENKTQLQVLGEIISQIKQKIAEDGKSPYDYIVVDTASALEEIAIPYATQLYKKTIMGKSFTGTNVATELPNGAGYQYLRTAFLDIYKQLEPLANKCLIICGHVKLASINKRGQDIQAKDISLTGRIKEALCRESDATGYMFREKETQRNIISFQTIETDLASGSRIEYLSGKEILISEKKDSTLVTYQENIFPSLKTEK